MNLKGKISVKHTFQIFPPKKKKNQLSKYSVDLFLLDRVVRSKIRSNTGLIVMATYGFCIRSHLGVNVIKILLSIVVL